MPFGVSKWPGASDPRGTAFCARGFAWGAFPAYRFTLRTTGALPPYDDLNVGRTLEFIQDVPNVCLWSWGDTFGTGPAYNLYVHGFEVPVDLPPLISIAWVVELTGREGLNYDGIERALFPNAITGWPLIALAPSIVTTSKLPNPVELVPRVHTWPLTP